MALTHEHITPLQAALAAAFPDTLLTFTRTSGPRCAAHKIPLHKPCPLPCLDVNLGLVFISSKAESYVEAQARSMEVPGSVSPQTHLDSRGTPSSQCLASVPGDVELPWNFCPSPCSIGHIETRGDDLHTFPITTEPSFPAFSFPLSFLLPFSCLNWHIQAFLFLSKLSPSAPEVPWRAALAAVIWQDEGERMFSRSPVGFKAPVSIQCNIYLLAGLCLAWQSAVLAMRAK